MSGARFSEREGGAAAATVPQLVDGDVGAVYGALEKVGMSGLDEPGEQLEFVNTGRPKVRGSYQLRDMVRIWSAGG